MSTTPLFDSIARRRHAADEGGAAPARTVPAVHAVRVAVPGTASRASVPVSAPDAGPTAPGAQSQLLVPPALVAAIDAIPARLAARLPERHLVSDEQLALVEAAADAITRAAVDAVVAELDRIAAQGIVRR